MINAFELERGRLRQVQVESIDELRHCQPVWIDFVDASDQERDWASTLYGIDLPEAHEIGDIEARARFFEEKTDNGDELHIRSDFFHEDDDGSQSIRVAFVLKNSMLFSVHPEDLPQFGWCGCVPAASRAMSRICRMCCSNSMRPMWSTPPMCSKASMNGSTA